MAFQLTYSQATVTAKYSDHWAKFRELSHPKTHNTKE